MTTILDRIPNHQVNGAARRHGGRRGIGSAHNSLRIVHTVSSLNVGGMEQFVVRIAEAQQRQGHHIAILALQNGALLDEASRLDISVISLDGLPKPMRIMQTVRQMAKFRPDIVHAHNPTSLHYATLGKSVTNARLLMTRHGEVRRKECVTPHQWRLMDAIVAVSSATANAVLAETPDQANKLFVIRNGVAQGMTSRPRQVVRSELGLCNDSVVGIMVARIDGMKGHRDLVEALEGLQRRSSTASNDAKITMLVVGDGSERGTIESGAREAGLTDDSVQFLGFRTDVTDLLGASDFFVLPSLAEGMPLSLLEAMAIGLPVIATDVGGIGEAITNNQDGILIPPADLHALQEAIFNVANSASLRLSLGRAAQKRVHDEFSFAAMVRQYDRLYENMLESRSHLASP